MVYKHGKCAVIVVACAHSVPNTDHSIGGDAVGLVVNGIADRQDRCYLHTGWDVDNIGSCGAARTSKRLAKHPLRFRQSAKCNANDYKGSHS